MLGCMRCLTRTVNLLRIATTAMLMFAWSPVIAGDLKVVVDIAPVHSLVARVMEGVGEPVLIMSRAASPHGYNMRPSDASKLNDADVLFWIGPTLTPWLDKAVHAVDDHAASVELMRTDGTTILDNRDDAAFSHNDGQHNSEHSHGHDEFDPHAWLDPENGKVWLGRIAAELARLDPANADAFQRNALAGKQEIDVAIGQVRSQLDQVNDPRFIVYHDAYQYFSSRFDLPTVGAISISDATRPSVSRIAEVRNLYTREKVNCIVVEPLYNKGLVQAVTGSAQARVVVIDPLATDLVLSPKLYVEWLLMTAEQLTECLS